MASTDNDIVVRPEKKATLRLGQRELSLLSMVVIGFVVVGLLFGAYRVYRSIKGQRDLTIGQSNLRMLFTAIQGYAEDYDGRLPKSAEWETAIEGYLSAPPNTPGGPKSYLSGPGDGERVRYVYNDLASDFNLRPPTQADWNKGLNTPKANEQNPQHKNLDPKYLVLLIEKPGAGPNAHVSIPPQDTAEGEQALFKELTFPHFADDEKNAATVVLYADGTVRRWLRRDFNP